MPKTVLAVGDTHFPFHSKAALRRTILLVKQLQPDVIVQMGDLYDMYASSRFPRSYNVVTPATELATGRHSAEHMWAELRKAAPGASCYQLQGNHDDRAVKRTLERAPELEVIVRGGIKELMTFPNVSLVPSSKHELVLDGNLYLHGFLKFGEHVRSNCKNVVAGHSHHGGVIWYQLGMKSLWEANAGWLGDIKSPVFNYRQQYNLHKTTTGVFYLDSLGPRFIKY